MNKTAAVIIFCIFNKYALSIKNIPYNVLIYITVRTKYSVRMYIIIDRYIFYVMFLFN